MGKRKERKKAKKSRSTLAEKADRHRLYQKSVQAPEWDIDFFTSTYRKLSKKTPRVLREDFCGTAYLATAWAAKHHRRRSIGIDFDRETLAWGQRNNVDRAGPKVAARVQLISGDVLDAEAPPADIICAMNFSYCVFKTRESLAAYLRAARRGLADDGLLVLELYGGTEAITELEEERPVGKVTYIWEQERYNPITNETVCHIHFRFKDGSRLDRAFTYDWRLWSIPEVRELLTETGFSDSRVYWEDVDEDGEGSGDYYVTEEVENQEGWLVYIVARK